MATPKPTKKIKTLDDFATAIHKDYLAISEKMATKDDIRQIREEMATTQEMDLKFKEVHGALRDIREDVQNLNGILVSKADLESLRDELLIEIKSGKHIDELRERLLGVERKLGIAKNRRAA